jgi:uroporphyrinogen decarboxylase
MMTSRERVLEAFNHRETDRIPVDFGGTSVSGIHVLAYADLIDYLGLDLDVKLFDAMLQLAMVEEPVLAALGVDTQKLYRPKPKFGIPIYEGWKKGRLLDGRPCLVPLRYSPVTEEDGEQILSEGKGIARPPNSCLYFDYIDHPLQDKNDIEDLKNFSLPAYSEADLRYLKEAAAASDRAVVAAVGGSLREKPCDLRGFEQFLVDLMADRKYAEYLLDILVEGYKRAFDQFKETVGDNVDIVKVTDDMGMKTGLMFSPKLYREVFKPRHRELFDYFKKGTNYKILLHCDGNITQIIPDLIEIGLDALNPVDTSAEGMDSAYLKKTFGRDLTFWGGLIEPANMVFMNLAQIKDYVRRRIDIWAPDGRFVYCYTHNVQPDVTPEKVVGFFELVKEWGRG